MVGLVDSTTSLAQLGTSGSTPLGWLLLTKATSVGLGSTHDSQASAVLGEATDDEGDDTEDVQEGDGSSEWSWTVLDF